MSQPVVTEKGVTMENNITVLIASCDKYEDAWAPFLKLWKIQWPDCPYNFVLSTETKTCNCDFFPVKTVNSGEGVSWSARLRDALDKIETEFVLFTLEDFFLTEKVDVELFNQAKKLIEENPEIGRINFMWERLGDTYEYKAGEDSYFKPTHKDNILRTNVVISLWRRDYFKKLLYKDEDPWQYEKNAPMRARYAGYEIYTQRYAVSAPVFHYCMNPADGLGITEGKWLNGNKILFEKYGITDVDFEKIGFFEKTITYDEIKAKRKQDHLASLKGIKKIREKIYNSLRGVKKKIKIKQKLKNWWYYKTYKE